AVDKVLNPVAQDAGLLYRGRPVREVHECIRAPNVNEGFNHFFNSPFQLSDYACRLFDGRKEVSPCSQIC
ncbi:hypothetical protein KAU08_04835, partial [bacterium]|nr:hypothetical protein [bacterium]